MQLTMNEIEEFLRAPHTVVVATLKRDGTPQLSTTWYRWDGTAFWISTNRDRAKYRNLRRDPRMSLEVTAPDGWSWATADGTATLTGPGTDPHGPEVEALVDYYRTAAGEHPDWDEYRAVMVSDRRVLMTMRVEHVGECGDTRGVGLLRQVAHTLQFSEFTKDFIAAILRLDE